MKKTPISIMLADDHMMFRSALHMRLDAEPDLTVIASVDDAQGAIEQATSLQPDIALLDIDMPGQCSFEAARQIKISSPETRIAFISGFDNDQYIEQVLALNASGYILKTESPEALANAIRSMMSGSKYFSGQLRSRMLSNPSGNRSQREKTRLGTLTRREREVLRYIAQGMSKKQIAILIHLSPRTVEAHCRRLMEKLAIHDRVELARYAIREGFAEV